VLGWACIVTQDWDPLALKVRLPNQMTRPLKVKANDQIWAFSLNTGYAYCHLPKPGRILEGMSSGTFLFTEPAVNKLRTG
jgi:hypothetical protein